MSIIKSINKAREKGISDEKILQEIIGQNPEKGKVFQEALKRGAKASQVLDETIKQNLQKKISEFKKTTSKIEGELEIDNKIKEKLEEEKNFSEEEKIEPEKIIEKHFIPKKESASEQQWVRLILFLILFIALIGFGTFWFWFLIINRQQPSSSVDSYTQIQCEENGFYWYDNNCHEKQINQIEEKIYS